MLNFAVPAMNCLWLTVLLLYGCCGEDQEQSTPSLEHPPDGPYSLNVTEADGFVTEAGHIASSSATDAVPMTTVTPDETIEAVFELRKPPTIVKSPAKNLIYRSDDQVTLECSGEGIPEVTYEWKKNGVALKLDRPNIKDSTNGTLTFQPVTSLDEGFYQCYVTNRYGTAVSDACHMQRAFLDPSSTDTSILIQRVVNQGEPFHIQASQKRSHPKPIYGWETARDAVDRNPSPFRLAKRMQIADNGDLYFAYALPEDGLGGRIYKSTAYNPYLDVRNGGTYTNVTVIRGSMSQVAPSLQYSSEPQVTAVVGGNVSLMCIFGGYPDFTVWWRGPNNRRQGGRHKYYSHNSELTITNVEPQDEGDYVCSANSQIATTPNTIKLTVEAIPSFKQTVDGPYDVNATDGDNVIFNCTADAKPIATVTWFRNGRKLEESNLPRRYTISKNGTSLTIQSVCRDCWDSADRTDLTVIQCNASNIYGYVFRSGYLNVLRKTLLLQPSEIRVAVDNNTERLLNFDCNVTSDPSTPLTVIWYKLDENGEKQRLHEDQTLKIKERLLSISVSPYDTEWLKNHLGVYVCVASNGYSEATGIVRLTEANPVTTTVQPTWFESNWWLLAIGAAFILLVLCVACCGACILTNKINKVSNKTSVRNKTYEPAHTTDDSTQLYDELTTVVQNDASKRVLYYEERVETAQRDNYETIEQYEEIAETEQHETLQQYDRLGASARRDPYETLQQYEELVEITQRYP